MRRTNKQIVDTIVSEIEGAISDGYDIDVITKMITPRYNIERILEAFEIINNKKLEIINNKKPV